MRDPHGVLAVVLEETRRRVQEKSPDETFCSVTVQPGDQVAFNFGAESCGGMIWTRLVAANLTNAFPNADATPNNCASRMAYYAEVGVLRSGHIQETILNEVLFPDDVDFFEDSRNQLDDMTSMKDALQAVGAEMDDFFVQVYNPVSPDGGIVGGVWSFVFGEE